MTNESMSNVYIHNKNSILAHNNEVNDSLSQIKQLKTHSSSMYKHQPARSITKLEKSSFKSGQAALLPYKSVNASNQTLRSKSRRNLKNGYGKLIVQPQPLNAFTNR